MRSSLITALLLQGYASIAAARPHADDPATTPQPAPEPEYITLTAITGVNNRTVFQCWQLLPPLGIAQVPGIEGSKFGVLGAVENAALAITPPGYYGGLHPAGVAQYIFFFSGRSRATLVDADDESWTNGPGILISADTPDISATGHITEYPGDTETVAAGIQIAGGKMPEHIVLHEGACAHNKKDAMQFDNRHGGVAVGREQATPQPKGVSG